MVLNAAWWTTTGPRALEEQRCANHTTDKTCHQPAHPVRRSSIHSNLHISSAPVVDPSPAMLRKCILHTRRPTPLFKEQGGARLDVCLVGGPASLQAGLCFRYSSSRLLCLRLWRSTASGATNTCWPACIFKATASASRSFCRFCCRSNSFFAWCPRALCERL